MTPKNKILPIKEIDLDKVSVHDLIKMLDRDDKDAYYILLTVKAADARRISRLKESVASQ